MTTCRALHSVKDFTREHVVNPYHSLRSWHKYCIIGTAAFVGITTAIYLFVLNQDNETKNLSFKNGAFPKVGSVIGHVSSLHIYPIKSCQAISIKNTKLDINGFLYDRLIMAINPRLTPITQRMIPKLALIKVEKISNDNTLSLSLPKKYNIEKLDLNLKLIETSNNASNIIDLHGTNAICKDCGDNAAEWLNNTLSIITGKIKKNNRFVMITNGSSRKLKDSLLCDLMDDCKSYDSTRLSDVAPIHFVSTSSLKSLNTEIPSFKEKIPIDRFRANIVFKPINDNYAFLEDHISMLQVGTLKLRIISLTSRCIMPSINQQNGDTQFFKSMKICEPLNTLKRTRCLLRYGITGLLPPKMGGTKSFAPVFGLWLGFISSQILDIQDIIIHEGDQVIVLKYKKNSNSFINQLLIGINWIKLYVIMLFYVKLRKEKFEC